MPHLPPLVLANATAILVAADVPLAVELPALGMVGLVLHFFLRRDARSHDEHDRRLTTIEQQLEDERDARDEERRLKHAIRNEVTAMRAAIGVLIPQAKRCTCGTMTPLIPVLERLALEVRESA